MGVDYKDFGKQVRMARRQNNLTQERLAEMIGISSSFLGHIERGTRVASLETLVAICNTLQVSPQHLLRGSLRSPESTQSLDHLSEDNRNAVREILRLAEDAAKYWN